MDVISTGNHAIDFFESHIIYLRAMEVRLSIAYSYMLVRKYKDSQKLLDSVSQFSNNFDAKYLIEESNTLLAGLYIYTGRIEEAKEMLEKVAVDGPVKYFLRLRIAFRESNLNEMKDIYNEYLKDNSFVKSQRRFTVMKITVKEAGIINIPDEEFVDGINELIDIGVRSSDIEVIDSSYNYLIRYYKNKRMYKKAFEASEKARDYRRYGVLKRKKL